MSALFKAATDAAIAATTITNLTIVWDDLETPNVPPQANWCRHIIKHNKGVQGSLSGALGLQRWVRGGLVTIQVFVGSGQGNLVSDQMITIIQRAYEGKTTSGGIIFRNVKFAEIGQSGPWAQTNFTIEFEYDEIK